MAISPEYIKELEKRYKRRGVESVRFNAIVRRKLGNKIRKFAEWIMPNYYICTHCGYIKYKQEEVTCWKCGIGEMVYKGDCA